MSSRIQATDRNPVILRLRPRVSVRKLTLAFATNHASVRRLPTSLLQKAAEQAKHTRPINGRLTLVDSHNRTHIRDQAENIIVNGET